MVNKIAQGAAKKVLDFIERHEIQRVKNAARLWESRDGGVFVGVELGCRTCLVGAGKLAYLSFVISGIELGELNQSIDGMMAKRKDCVFELRTIPDTDAMISFFKEIASEEE